MFKIILLSISLVFLPLSVCAESEIFGSVQGYSQYRWDDGKSGAELGIGASAQLNPYMDVRFIGTGIFDETDKQPRINIGLIDIHVPSEYVGIRLGRVQHELGFYTAQLNWAPARDLHLAPQGIYRENFRYMLRSGDGAQIYTRYNSSDVKIDLTYSYTKAVLFPMEDITKVWNSVGGEVSGQPIIQGFNVGVEVPVLKTYFRYDRQVLDFTVKNTVYNGLFDGQVDTTGHYFGTKTELTDTIDVTLEYLEVVKTGTTWNKMDVVAPNSVPKSNENSKGYGVSGSYNFNDNFKFIGGWSAFYNYESDRYGRDTEKYLALPAKGQYMEDTFIGAKYRQNTWISTLEYHHMNGTATLSKTNALSSNEQQDRVIFTVTKIF